MHDFYIIVLIYLYKYLKIWQDYIFTVGNGFIFAFCLI